jgi:membrane-bound ClpP family serine protease
MHNGFTSFNNVISLLVGAVVGFASYVYNLFGYTIPSFFAVYLKEIGAALIMMAVFVFAIAWLMKAKPSKKPRSYLVKVFDVYGIETSVDGMRTEFKTHDVAWSFMKEYKKSYPIYNFALVSDLPNSEKMTIFRYL